MKTLGIFVASDRYPDYVLALARAAGNRGLMVRIHFSGSGVRMVRRVDFNQLATYGQISICRESAASFRVDHEKGTCRPQFLVPARHIARIIQMCDRHLFI